MRKGWVIPGVLLFMASFFWCGEASAEGREIEPDFTRIDVYIEKEMKECRIPGMALCVVHGERVLYMKGYGIADPSDRAVTPETPFVIGSVSKPVTALAVMQLVDAGKISLDAPVTRYLPWFRLSGTGADAVTIRHLLTHTSGLDTNVEFRAATLRGDDTSIQDLVRKMSVVKPVEAPGNTFRYGSANYIILGAVVEAVSGVSYAEYLERNIFLPLGMRRSSASKDKADADGLAAGYETIFGFPRPTALPYRTDFVPAWNVVSSAEDLSRFLIALLNGSRYGDAVLLSSGAFSEMTAPQAAVSRSVSYGFGWYVTSGSLYHGGDIPGYQAKIKLLPEDRLGIALLYNTSSAETVTLFGVGFRDRLESGLISLVYGYEPDPPPGGPLDLNRYPMSVTYTLYLGLVAAVGLAFLFSAVRLFLRARRPDGSARFSRREVLLSALLNLALSLGILLAVPAATGVSWRFVLAYQPGPGTLALSVSIALLALGAVKAALLIKITAARRGSV